VPWPLPRQHRCRGAALGRTLPFLTLPSFGNFDALPLVSSLLRVFMYCTTSHKPFKRSATSHASLLLCKHHVFSSMVAWEGWTAAGHAGPALSLTTGSVPHGIVSSSLAGDLLARACHLSLLQAQLAQTHKICMHACCGMPRHHVAATAPAHAFRNAASGVQRSAPQTCTSSVTRLVRHEHKKPRWRSSRLGAQASGGLARGPRGANLSRQSQQASRTRSAARSGC